jgi:uncharacterized protein (TIGR02996 family)
VDDLKELYDAILQNPGEDTPRLMYADALLERDHPGDRDRAEFIQKQFELHRIGPPRRQVAAECHYRNGHYHIIGSREDKFRPGERIDIVKQGLERTLFHQVTLPGMLVKDVQPDDTASGTVRVTLQRDEHSQEYPHSRVGHLQTDCWNLLHRHDEWWPRRDFTADIEIYQEVHRGPLGQYTCTHLHRPTWEKGRLIWERGFLTHFQGSGRLWLHVGEELTSSHPIDRVHLTSRDAYTVWEEYPDRLQKDYPNITHWHFPGDGT